MQIGCLGLVAAAVLLAADVRADDRECIRQSDEGQQLRDEGNLVGAKKRLAACARTGCPSIVAAACSAWLTGIAERIPSAVFVVPDALLADPTARFFLDDEAFVPERVGRAQELNPGPHRFTVRAGSAPPVTTTFVLQERGALRAVHVSVPARVDAPSGATVGAPPPQPARGLPALLWAGVGVGAVGVGLGSVFGAMALSDQDRLRDGCGATTSCSAGEVSAVRRLGIAADASFIVGALGLGVAVYAWLTRPELALEQAPR